jgi:hypothetical protein
MAGFFARALCGLCLLCVFLPSVRCRFLIVEVCVRALNVEASWPSQVCVQTVLFSFDLSSDEYTVVQGVNPSSLLGAEASTAAAYIGDSDQAVFFCALANQSALLELDVDGSSQAFTNTVDTTTQGFSYLLTGVVVEGPPPFFTVSDSSLCPLFDQRPFYLLGEPVTEARALFSLIAYTVCAFLIWSCVFLVLSIRSAKRVHSPAVFGVQWLPVV